MARTGLIAIVVVGLVAVLGLVLVLSGDGTGNAAKIFSTECFDYCREKNCKGIDSSDGANLYPCLNDCLNDCWSEYKIKGTGFTD